MGERGASQPRIEVPLGDREWDAAPPRWFGRLTYRLAPTTGMPRRRALRARGHRPAHSGVSGCVDALSRDPASRPARRLLARRPLPSGFEGSTRQPLNHARAPLTITVRGLLATMASLDTPTRAGRDSISPPLSKRCVAHDGEALIGGGTWRARPLRAVQNAPLVGRSRLPSASNSCRGAPQARDTTRRRDGASSRCVYRFGCRGD
jgi:hypothetical protein